MLRLALYIVLLLNLAACGQKGAVTDAKFVIAGLTAAETASGSVMLTAFNPKSQMISRIKMQNSSETLELPDGEWVISVVYWDDIDTEAALKVRCGHSQAVLEGKELAINLELTENNCKGADFNASPFDVAGELQPLELNQCATFGSPAASCDATFGTARSAQLVFPAILLSPIDNPALNASAPSIVSSCVGIAPNNGTESLTTMLPSGSADAPIPFVIRTYSGPGCTDDVTVHNFRRGLLTGDEGSLRIHDHATNITRILVRSGSLEPLHASVSIPAESSYKFNLSNFVTGGTPPYSFTRAPVTGTLTGTMFSGSNAPESYTVTVTDANSIVTTFSLSTVIATHHTIFEGNGAIIGKWSVSRPTSQLSMLSPGVFSTVSSNIPRFLKTPFLASPLIEADSYLVIEKNSTTNRLQNPVNYDSATWVKPTGITVATQGMTDISLNQEHFLVAKTTIAGTSLYQSAGALVGNHVGSVYLKEGSSRFAALRLENDTGTCTGLVVDLQTGQNVAMSGCPLLNTGPGLHGTQYIGGGWWRVWVTRQFISGTGSGVFKIYPAWNSSLSATGDTNVLGSVYSFNAQLEAADRPLFPMFNYNATRGIESASMDVPTSINLSTGTFLFDWHAREPEPNKTLMSFCNGTTELMKISIASGLPRVAIQGSNFVQESSLQDTTLASQNRIAFKLDSGAATLFKRNDSTPATTASGMSAGTPTSGYLARDCAASPTYHNLGARRFGYWSTVFEDVVLKEMSNDTN